MTPQRTAADQAIIEQLTQLQNAVTRYTHAVTELRGLTVNDVLLDELLEVPDEGYVSRSFSAPAGYLAVLAYGSDVTATSDPPAGPTAPTLGTGVKVIPGGTALGWAFVGTTVTIYGTPGDLVLLAAYTRPMQPFVGASGAVIGGTP